MVEPVSWMLIEEGWRVVDRGGDELGRVHEVIGDSGADIFNGLAVSPGVLRGSRYVPAELVATIVEGRVQLDLDEGDFKRLDEHEATPPSAEIRANTTDLPTDRH
jgi:PRC-barrel domain